MGSDYGSAKLVCPTSCAVAAETEAPTATSPAVPSYDPDTQVFAFTEPRKLICYGCTDRPDGCWKNREFGCMREYRKAEEEAVLSGRCPLGKWNPPAAPLANPSRKPCPSCDLPTPEIRTLRDVHAGVREILTRELQPPAFKAEMGIVTSGEGAYEPGIVIGIKILRDHAKCDLPLTVFHRGQWNTCLKGYDVTLLNSQELQASHPAKHYGGWESKTYAVMHAGYRKAMFLDGDAYLVKDPAPLFRLLDQHRLVIWYDHGPGRACGPSLDNQVCPLHHQNGGQYLVDLATYWREFQAQRFLDNHSHIWYREGRLGDECSHRYIRHLIQDRGVLGADWVDRTRGVGILARYPAYGPAYVAHRMRRESKLILGTQPRSNPKWPFEREVLDLFARMSPGYIEQPPQAERKRQRRASRRKRLGLIRTETSPSTSFPPSRATFWQAEKFRKDFSDCTQP